MKLKVLLFLFVIAATFIPIEKLYASVCDVNSNTITGTATLCQRHTGVTYSVPVISNATGNLTTESYPSVNLPVGSDVPQKLKNSKYRLKHST